MIKKEFPDIFQILINQLNTDVNIEFTIKNIFHRWEYEYNFERTNMFGRDDDNENANLCNI